MKTIYVIYRGQGMDSGFSNYCSSWEGTPMKLNGETLWFDSKEVAEKIAEDLKEKSADKFYSAGLSDSYDGNFPIEYQCREVVVPENSPSDLNSFQALVNQEYGKWNWFSLNGVANEVNPEVKELHPDLYECRECKDFGYTKEYINPTGVCVYCELEDDYNQQELEELLQENSK